MGLRSWTLSALLIGLTVLLPLAVLVRVTIVRAGRRAYPRLLLAPRDRPRTLLGLAVRWLVLVLAQALAVASVLVVANRQLVLYQEWSDLFGGYDDSARVVTMGQAVPAQSSAVPHPQNHPVVKDPLPAGSVTPSGAQLIPLTVHGQASGARGDVLVWLPKAYSAAGRETQDFPVLFFLAGSPGTAQGLYQEFNFDRVAAEAIDRGVVRPFIAVLVPVMTHPPHDTECLDLPHGPQSETWLATDVPNAVRRSLRVSGDPRQWAVAGYSTGGLCATNLLLRHRDKFGAAVSIGGYFHPWARGEGDLFGGSEDFRRSVTPLWQFQNTPPQPTRLLIISSVRDRSSWDGPGPFDGDSKAMIDAAARWPGTAAIVLDKGAHDFAAYGPTLPRALEWLGQGNNL